MLLIHPACRGQSSTGGKTDSRRFTQCCSEGSQVSDDTKVGLFLPQANRDSLLELVYQIHARVCGSIAKRRRIVAQLDLFDVCRLSEEPSQLASETIAITEILGVCGSDQVSANFKRFRLNVIVVVSSTQDVSPEKKPKGCNSRSHNKHCYFPVVHLFSLSVSLRCSGLSVNIF